MTQFRQKFRDFLERNSKVKNIFMNISDSPHNKKDELVKDEALYALMKDSYFRQMIDKHKKINGRYKLVDVIHSLELARVEANDKKKTQGTYHILMPYIHALYGIDNRPNNTPNYNDIHKQHGIVPVRIEYEVLYWLQTCIKNDPFFQKIYDFFEPSYQFKFEKSNKIYDVAYEKVKLIIEVQEDGYHHNDNDDDIDKKCVVIKNNYRVYYIQPGAFNPNGNIYELWENIKTMFLGALFFVNPFDMHIKNEYMAYAFITDLQLQSKKLMHKDIFLKDVVENIDNNAINTANEWYLRGYDKIEKRCIAKDELYDWFPILFKSEHQKTIREIIERYGSKTLNGIQYISYDTIMLIIEMITTDDINFQMAKERVSLYLIKIRGYNDHINKCIQTYIKIDEKIFTNFWTGNEVINSKKLLEKYQTNAENALNRVHEMQLTTNKLAACCKLSKALFGELLPEFRNSLSLRIPKDKQPIIRNIDALIELYNTIDVPVINPPIIDKITLTYEIGHNITNDVANFNIIYTGSVDDCITVDYLNNYCKEFNFHKNVIDRIISRCSCANINNYHTNHDPTLLYGLKLNVTTRHDQMQINDTDDNNSDGETINTLITNQNEPNEEIDDF
jgi:hypothetical protein